MPIARKRKSQEKAKNACIIQDIQSSTKGAKGGRAARNGSWISTSLCRSKAVKPSRNTCSSEAGRLRGRVMRKWWTA